MIFKRQPHARRLATALAVMIALFSAGCSGNPDRTYPVRGKVVFQDDEPVRTGTVELRCIDKPYSARGKISRDGSFELGTFDTADGAVAGRHKAVVIQVFAAGEPMDATIVHDHGDVVDRRFADYETSRLEYEIQPQDNDLKIVVQRKK